MSKVYEIGIEDGITIVRFLKSPSLDEAKVSIEDVAGNYPYERRIWDFADLKLNMSSDELKEIARHGKKFFVKPNRAAYVAHNALTYGNLRVFRVHRDMEDSNTMPFYSIEEALAWIRDPATISPT